MRRLDFLSPTFQFGLNYTVRLGLKWADLRPGDKIQLAQTNGPVFHEATVEQIFLTKFNWLPQVVFDFEHAPAARTPEGLIEAMRAAYGDAFKLDSIVTVIGFTPNV